MADVFTKKERSVIMSKVHSKDTSIEVKFRTCLWNDGIRGWRKNYKKLDGAPDIVFTKYKIAIFIDGCFWHGCTICSSAPKDNREYWVKKINKNIERDRLVNSKLKDAGWTVIRIWEHDIEKSMNDCIAKLKEVLEAKRLAVEGSKS